MKPGGLVIARSTRNSSTNLAHDLNDVAVWASRQRPPEVFGVEAIGRAKSIRCALTRPTREAEEGIGRIQKTPVTHSRHVVTRSSAGATAVDEKPDSTQ